MKQKDFFLFLLPIIPIVIAICLIYKIVNPKEYLIEYIYGQEYSGKIVDKYLDKNHAYKRVVIDLGTSNVILAAESWIELYENVEIGDSLVKIHGQGEMNVYRKTKLIYTSIFDLNSGMRILNRFKTREVN